KNQARQMAMGTLTYTSDYNGAYPDGPRGRTDPAVIAWDEGEIDFRSSFREYFGTRLNDIMKCPLISSYWEDDDTGLSNIDDTPTHAGMVKSPYAFYYGQEGVKVDGTKRDQKWARVEYMRRVGDTWSPNSAPALKFNVLLSDVAYWNGWGGEHILTTHNAFGNGAPEGGNWTDHNKGHMYGWGKEATANFALDDGSVSTELLSLAAIYDVSLTGIRRQTHQQSYVVPTDLSR
ncbi:MAG: hypothetical protein R3336_08700, partial [Phycisphaeraceae bacterium]|nr:hypothetical protein [Phycisphaeraceae bacterium]